MVTKSKHSAKRKRLIKSPAHRNRGLQLTLAGLVFFAVASGLGYWWWAQHTRYAGPDSSKLSGKWLRPDGGYVLELRDIGPDGSLKAAYYNPRPINVSKASWHRTDGILQVFIELRDINYPGSAYTLSYNPKSQSLEGVYFQAIERQRYRIFFVRASEA